MLRTPLRVRLCFISAPTVGPGTSVVVLGEKGSRGVAATRRHGREGSRRRWWYLGYRHGWHWALLNGMLEQHTADAGDVVP